MKRKWSVCLIVTIIISFFVFIPTTALPADVKGTACQQAVEILTSLKIMNGYEDGTFETERTITRAEFATILSKILGFDTIDYEGNEREFSDVSSNHWAFSYISLMVNMGIVSGYEDGSFRPDEPLLFEQAVKMLVSTCGYDIYAEQNGGYPIGYLIIASQEGITKKVDAQISLPINRGMVAILVWNALNVELMEPVSYGANIKYVKSPEKTLLSERLKITKLKGQVTAVGKASLKGDYSLRDDEIEIDDKVFKTTVANIDAFLGYNVEYYVKQESYNDIEEVLAILIIDDNTVTRVNAEDIMVQTTATRLVYSVTYADNYEKIEEEEIPYGVRIIYNGRYLPRANLTDEMVRPLSGEVVLIKSNKNDVLIITDYMYYIVDIIDAQQEIVYDKTGKTLILDSQNNAIEFSMKKDGRLIEIKDLTQWDILAVEMSYEHNNKQYIEITVLSDQVKGQVTEKDNRHLWINEVQYKINPHTIINTIIGSSGTFYLDQNGAIIAANFDDKSMGKYGYMIEYGISQDMSKRIELRILTVNGVAVFKTAEKINLNGVSVKMNAETLNAGNSVLSAIYDFNENVFRSQLVAYDLNSQGQINVIKTSEYQGDGDNSIVLSSNRASRTYRGGAVRSFNNEFLIDDQTLIFVVPKIISNVFDSDAFRIEVMSRLVSTDTYDVEAYNENSGMEASIIVIYEDWNFAKTPTNTTSVLVVDRIATVINENGEMTHKLYGIQLNRNVEILAKDLEVIKDLQQGDIIQYSTRSPYNWIDKVEKFVSSRGWWNSTAAFICGNVYHRASADVMTVLVDDGTIRPFASISRTTPYIYDENKGSVSIGTAADILAGDEVFLRLYYGQIRDIVIIRRNR